jgi:hypothetical protein
VLVKSDKISLKPWKNSIHLILSEGDLEGTSYSYPVDIRLDKVSRIMVILGFIDEVKVYTALPPSFEIIDGAWSGCQMGSPYCQRVAPVG